MRVRAISAEKITAVIHTRIVSGNRLNVALAPKGFGSENMSRVALFPPALVGQRGRMRHAPR